MRAVQGPGTILERIVEKKLLQVLGQGGYVSQYALLGGRTFIGGYVVDFIITATVPPIALEVQAAYWHTLGEAEHMDEMRARIVESQGYKYAEIYEWEIWAGDDYLERRVESIVGY